MSAPGSVGPHGPHSFHHMSNVKLNQAQGTDSNWDFAGKRLEQQIGGTDFVSSESTLLLTTPRATYDDEAIRMAVAVGLVQDISFNQQRQATQIYEVGSRRKYTFSSGRTSGQMSLSRVLFDGQSLMKAVTREEQIDLVGSDFVQTGDPSTAGDIAGYGDFYVNLGASLFSKPVGLIMVFRDLGNQNIGALFFREAYMISHRMGISSRQPFLSESVSVLYEGILPLQHRQGAGPNANIKLPFGIGG